MKAPSLILCVCALLVGSGHGAGQGTAFIYQGETPVGYPANGVYDFQFALFDADTGGAQVGNTLSVGELAVSKRIFSVILDFGTHVFDGAPRWLEVRFRRAGSAEAFVEIGARPRIFPIPYAIHAGSASTVQRFDGPISDGQLSVNIPRLNSEALFKARPTFAPPTGPPFAVGNTNRVDRLNADLLDGQDSTAFAPMRHDHSANEITAGTLPDSRLSTNVARLRDNQTFTGTQTFSPATGPPFLVNSTNTVPNLNSEMLGGVPDSGFWKLGGNPTGLFRSFIGSLDSNPLDLGVNGFIRVRVDGHGQYNYAVGGPEGPGTARAGLYVMRQTTVDTLPVELFLDGQSQRLQVPRNSFWVYELEILGVTTNNLAAQFTSKRSFLNLTGTIVKGGGSEANVGPSPPAGRCLGVEVMGDTIRLQVKGDFAIPIRWVAVIRTTEVQF